MRVRDLIEFVADDGLKAMKFLIWLWLLTTPRLCAGCHTVNPSFKCYSDYRPDVDVPYFMCTEKIGELVVVTTPKGFSNKTGQQ